MKRSLFPALAAAASLALAGVAVAQPANDICANAIPVADQSVTTWNPLGATQSLVLPCENFPDAAIDVWYSYTTTGPGMVTVTTCGGPTEFNSLGVYAGCGGALVACDSWSCSSLSQSEVTFQASGPATYYICLVGYADFEGPGYLAINRPITVPPPANDTCLSAQDLPGPGSYPFNSAGAATDGPSGSCNVNNRPDTRDVFFRYTPTSDGWASFDTLQDAQSQRLDTTIQLFQGCTGPLLACNDDVNWTGAFSGLWPGSRTCPVHLAAGTTYIIRIASAGASSPGGLGILRLSSVPGPLTYATPANAIPEPGPDCDDDYDSDVNYGCNPRVTPTDSRATEIQLCETHKGHIYGRTTPVADGTLVHDYDAYHFTLSAPNTIHVTGQAQFVGLVSLFKLPCGTGTVFSGQLDQYTNPECGAAEFDLTWSLPAGEYHLGVGTAPFSQPLCGQNNEYWFHISGSAPCPPPCPADFNVSGDVSVQDIFDFLAAYFSNDPTADFNGAGGITVQDIFDYLAAYFAGCP